MFPIRGMYLEAIDRAQHNIWITAAYFIPDRDILHGLVDAAARGVDVRILLPREVEPHRGRLVVARLLRRLLDGGVKILLFRDAMVHAKTATIDGRWTTIGTANIDRLSLTGNYEINLEILDARWPRRWRHLRDRPDQRPAAHHCRVAGAGRLQPVHRDDPRSRCARCSDHAWSVAGPKSPLRWARAAASTRLLTCSLARMFETCTLTVLGLMRAAVRSRRAPARPLSVPSPRAPGRSGRAAPGCHRGVRRPPARSTAHRGPAGHTPGELVGRRDSSSAVVACSRSPAAASDSASRPSA